MNLIKLRKNNLCVENISTVKLAKKYKTPFYCYSLGQLKNNFNNFILLFFISTFFSSKVIWKGLYFK